MAGTIAPWAENGYGVRTRYLDYAAPGMANSTMTYHAIAIVNDSNALVGRIQSWNPSTYGRDGRHVYELSSATWGRAVDYVPGKNNAYTIECSRVEVWGQETEKTFGFTDVWTDLIDQNRPFTVSEYLFKGQTPYRHWMYKGCWFQSKNMNSFEAENDPTIVTSGTIAFVSRQKVM